MCITHLDAEVQSGVQAGEHVHQDVADEDARRLGGENYAAPGAVVPQAAHQATVQRVQPAAHPAVSARPTLYRTLWYYRCLLKPWLWIRIRWGPWICIRIQEDKNWLTRIEKSS
jgi:hypothetical protein